jgi:hypothetical protein
MKTLTFAIFIFASLSVSAWCQAPQPKTAIELAKYLGPDREHLLYEGAKKDGKLVWYTSS